MTIDFTGRTLGGYRILRKLGQGGMAVVYKAQEESLNRVVALKVIAQHLSQDEQFIARFQREAQAAAQLNHPNIVQVYAIGEDQGVHYFSMEFVKGRSLAEIIEAEGFLTAGRALPIIAQAAEALAVAHEAGIVHRDIKPANIMVDSNGRVKVADFGIAQMATATRMTQSGMLVGTPEFISPEQCQGEKLDGRSDIYSLGITLYQLLAGRTPFNADTPAALVFQIVEGPGTPVGELNPTVSADVQAIVAKMMHVDRNQRYQSAEDLVHALRSANTQPVTSTRRAHPAPGLAAGAAEPTEAMPQEAAAPTEAMPETAASGATPQEAAAPTEAMPQAAPTEALPETAAAPTEAMPRESTGAPTEPAAAASAASMPATEALPAAAKKPPSAHSGAATAPAQAAAEKTQRPSPATQAYATSSGSNRAALLGLAAAVLILITVAIVGWQFMGSSAADEPFDPTAEARPAGAPATENEDASGATEPQGADRGGETSSDAGGDATGTTGDQTGTTATGADPGAAAPTDTATRGATADAGAPQERPAGGGQSAAQDPPASAAGEAAVSGGQVGGGEAQGVAVEEPAFPAPAANTIVAETSGEYDNVEQVHAWLESAFADRDFEVIDYARASTAPLEQSARFHLVTGARQVGSEQLEYFGNRTTQYTVSLTSRVIDLSSGATVVGPEVETVKYTTVNMQQNLQQGVNVLARRMARELRQLIR